MTLAFLRRFFCAHGFHDLNTAEPIGSGDIEVTGKNNHPALLLSGDYEIYRCQCGEFFTTGIKNSEAKAS